MVPEAADGCGASGQECGRPGCDQPAAACAAACAGAIPDTAAGQERGQREGRAAEAPTGRRGAGGCRPAGRVGVGGGQRAHECNLFDVLVEHAGAEEARALAFQTPVLVPPRCAFLLADVARLRPLLPGARRRMQCLRPLE